MDTFLTSPAIPDVVQEAPEPDMDEIWDRFHADFKTCISKMRSSAEQTLTERFETELDHKHSELEEHKGIIMRLKNDSSLLIDALKRMNESRTMTASYAATIRERERVKAAMATAFAEWRRDARATAYQRRASRIIRERTSLTSTRAAFSHWMSAAYTTFRARMAAEREATALAIRQAVETELQQEMTAMKSDADRLRQENEALLLAQQEMRAGLRQAFMRGASTLRLEALNTLGQDIAGSMDIDDDMPEPEPDKRSPVQIQRPGNDQPPAGPEHSFMVSPAPVPTPALEPRSQTYERRTARVKVTDPRPVGSVRGKSGSCSAGTAINTKEMMQRVRITRGE